MENVPDGDLAKLHLEKLCGESPHARNGLITDEAGDFDEEPEWWIRYPAARKFRDFFCKKVIRRGKRRLRVCKLLYIDR